MQAFLQDGEKIMVLKKKFSDTSRAVQQPSSSSSLESAVLDALNVEAQGGVKGPQVKIFHLYKKAETLPKLTFPGRSG